MCQT